MVAMNASNVNTAAWKAYGSPSARHHQRPPLAPAAGAGAGAAPPSPTGNKLPRVGGFKPRRPQSAPGSGAGTDGAILGELGPIIAAMASTVSVAAAAGRRKGAGEMMDVGVLAVEHPDPIRAGRTDSGKVMFEQTLPTDPYAKYIWEEQARKARVNMSRHIAAMAAAAAVNGGSAFSHGGGGGGGGASRPGSASRGASATAASGPGTLGGASAAAAMRPRFTSTTLAEVARHGTDHKPPTVVGFGAPDLTEDGTMPGPGDPRWAYTRLGRSQIGRLQHSLKMAAYHPRLATRPSSAPALAGGAAGGGGAAAAAAAAGGGVGTETSVGGGAVGIGSPERSMARQELLVMDPFSDPAQGGAAAAAAIGAAGGGSGRASELLEAQRSSPAAMLRTASGSGGTRPGSATYGRASNLARTGSPGLPRPGSAGLVRHGSSTGMMRPASASGAGGGLASSASLAAMEVSNAAAVPAVRGASAGRTREVAPNPRVDLRAYLAESEADAEEDDEGTEMLPVDDLAAAAAAAAASGLVYDAAGGVLLDGVPVPAEVLQSMPVPADQLAARLAEMVAAVAVVAAQKQLDGDDGDTDGDHQKHVRIQEIDDDGRDVALPPAEPPPPPPPAAPAPASPRFSRPEGDDALLALHGASNFGNRGPGRFGNNGVDFTAARSPSPPGQYDSDGSGGGGGGGVADWGFENAVPPMEQPLGLGLGLGRAPRRPGGGGGGAGGAGRPTSARPMSARPTSARPTSAMPGRGRSGSPVRGLGGEGGGGGMDVILELSEG